MTYSRATLPAEFYDRTSDLLLAQPEPQYLYAELWLGALGASLETPGSMGLPSRDVSGVGAAYTPAEANRLRLSNPMFREVIAAKVDFNGEPGNTIRINRPVFTNSTYTEAVRKVPAGSSISTTTITPSSQQVNLTLFRYAGPYDATASAVRPYGIEAFDANMGVHNAVQLVGTHLRRDFHRFIDKAVIDLLDLAANTDYPEGMSADNDATVSGMYPLTYEQVSRCERKMDIANLPTFGDGYRALVLSPTQVDQLRSDVQYQRASMVHQQYNILFPQYVASVNKFHIFKSTTLTSSNNSSSVAIERGHAIAPGVLLAGMGRMPRVAASTDDNYGETIKVIWIGDLAFGCANTDFVRSVRSSA